MILLAKIERNRNIARFKVVGQLLRKAKVNAGFDTNNTIVNWIWIDFA